MADLTLKDALELILKKPSPTLTPTFDPSVVRNHIFPWIPPKRKPIFGSSDDSHTQEQYDLRRTVEDLERNEWEKKVFRARLFPWATAPPLPSLLLNKHRTGTPSQTSRFYHEHWLYATGKIISRPRYPAHLRLDYSTPWSSDYANLDEMAARLLTQSNSKLSNRNIIAILSDEESWSTLNDEDQRKLYEMLPIPAGDAAVDHRVHPLKGPHADHVKHFLREWQEDLKGGRKTKTWGTAAQQASDERAGGAFDEWKEGEKEAFWGQKGQANEEK